MRLTRSIKEQIVKNAEDKAGFNARKKELDDIHNNIAEAIRIDSLGGAEKAKEYAETIEAANQLLSKVPQDLYYVRDSKRGYMYCNVAGRSHRMRFKVPSCAHYEYTLKADHPLAIEWEQYISNLEDYDSELKNLKTVVMAAMSNVNTVKQLCAAWPEAIELIPTSGTKEGNTLPSVDVAVLNKVVGLPTKE